MGPIGIPELLVIVALVGLIFGASRLPDWGRGLNKSVKNFRETRRGDLDDTRREGRS
jgi:sec-independent protein translocase protein TatA